MAQGPRPIGSPRGRAEIARNAGPDERSEGPQEGAGQLSNPPQRRLSPGDADDLIASYQAGATIKELAARYHIHRTTVAKHLDRHRVPRHHEQTAWDDELLKQAAELYASGFSLTDVAHQFGIDAQTVANRFRRAGVPVRPRRGWVHSE